MADPETDERFMRRALELAARGLGRVEPNPMVGAVVVGNGQVVGEGHHERFGGPHAEIAALEAAGDAARGADLYVTLEPCCHHGKTPPCTEAVLESGIYRVVAALADPFPKVSGVGLARLRKAGLLVEVGPLAEEARLLNAAYFKRQETGLPLVTAKWAMTLDGRIASPTGESRWISSDASRLRVHEMRRVADGVLVGVGTVTNDAPSLTVRHVEPFTGRGQPTRIVLDEKLEMAPSREPAASAAEVPVLVYTKAEGLEHAPERAAALEAVGCALVAVDPAPEGVALRPVLEDLYERGMSRVLVEGGARVFGSFFGGELVDRVAVFVNPRILGAAAALGPVAGPDERALCDALAVSDLEIERLGPDVLLEGRLGRY